MKNNLLEIIKKYKILAIGLVILFVTVVYNSYAFFTSTLEVENGPNNIITETGVLLLTYDGTESVSLDHAMPGDTLTKNFTVKNDGTFNDTAFDIMWSEVYNDFADKGDLYYTLTCETDDPDGECREITTLTQVPNTTSNQELTKNILIDVGETQTYHLTILFQNKDENQNDNQGKTLSANILINEYKSPTISMNIQDGTLDKTTDTVEYGETSTFTVTPDTGFLLENMSVNCNNGTENTIVGNEITVGPVRLSTTCYVTFTPAYNIHGYVVDQFDNPVTGATVETHSEIRSAITDSTGYFELISVVSGDHELEVKRNIESLHKSNFRIKRGERFSIAGNEITASDITKPIKIRVKIESTSQKLLQPDNTYRLIVKSHNGVVSQEKNILESGANAEVTVTPNTGYSYNNTSCTAGVEGTWANNKLTVNNLTTNTECTVSFGAETYSVTLQDTLHSQTYYQNVVYGEEYGVLPTLTDDNYTFSGWYTASSGGTRVTSSTIVNTASNHTLYARWNTNPYEVVYDCSENGGSCSIPNEMVDYGSNVDLTKTATKTGYEFVGWNTDKDATAGLSTLIMNTQGKTLYAIFRKTISITYNSNGAELTKQSDSCTIFNKISTCTFTSPNITREGFAVIGFNTSVSAETSTLNKTTEFIASSSQTYSAITYKDVYGTYYTNGNTSFTLSGTTYTDISKKIKICRINNSASKCSGIAPTITAPEATPTLIGWSLGATTRTATYTSGGSISNISSDVTLYAQTIKQAISPRVTFDSNGATSIGNTSLSCNIPASYNGAAQATTCSVTTPTITRSGFTIDGWSTNKDATSGTAANTSLTISDEQKYYALSHKTVTASYDGNGSTGGSTASNTCTIRNSATTCTLTLANNGFTKTGNTFSKWASGSVGGTQYTAGTEVSLASNTTYYAIWDVNSQLVTYNYSENGGTSATKTSANVNYNASVDLTPTATKTGWTFVGWNTSATATTKLDTLVMGTGNITLYAIYRKEKVTLSASWNANGATLSSTSNLTCELAAVYNKASQATSCTVTSPTITAPANTPTIVGFNITASSTTNNSSYNTSNKALTLTTSNTAQTWYAITKKAATSISASFDLNGATSIGNTSLSCNIPASYNGTAQATTCSVTTPTITRSGFTIDGWSTNRDATSGTAVNTSLTISDEDKYYALSHKTLTGTYYKNGNTSFALGGTTYTDTSKVLNICTIRNYNTTCSGTAPTITAASATPTLIGWSTGATTYSSAYASGASIPNITSNQILYAQSIKTAVNRTATTNKNVSSATGSNTNATCTIAATYNGASQATSCDITMPANPYTLTGWTFVGWSTSATATTGTVAGGTITTSTNPTVYAIWKKDVSVTFNKNGGVANTSCSGTMYNGATSFSCTAPASTTYSGWTFNGYSSSASSTTAGVAAGSSYSTTIALGTSTSTAYHNWKKDFTATLTKSTGVSAIGATSKVCKVYNGGTSCTIVLPTITLSSGYDTKFWGTSTSATSGLAENANVTLTGNITYYAIGKDTILPTCTISGNPSSWVKTATLSVSSTSTDLSATPYSWTSSTSGFSTTQTKGITANGTYTAWVQDVHGNPGSCSVSVTKVDNVGPNISKATATAIGTNQIQFTITASDLPSGNNSGITTYYYKYQGQASYTPSSSATITMTDVPPGTYITYVAVGDAVNNITYLTTNSVTLTSTPINIVQALKANRTAYSDKVSSVNVTSSSGIDFGKTQDGCYMDFTNYTTNCGNTDSNGAGLYYTNTNTENNTTVYYLRGEIEDNYVVFGGYCWRMMRTNESGGVRMRYSGPYTNNECLQTGDAIGTPTTSFYRSFNNVYTDNAGVGYMYGALGATSYSNTHRNTNSAIIKQNLEDWYRDYIYSQGSTVYSKVENAIYCNDRSIGNGGTYANMTFTTLGYGANNYTLYGGMRRMFTGGPTGTTKSSLNATPQFKCPQANDKFTLTVAAGGTSGFGNNATTYPIGLLTADEVVYAGGVTGAENERFYLFTTTPTFTMTPLFYAGDQKLFFAVVSQVGNMYMAQTNSVQHVLPVISLKSTTMVAGSGTYNSPYIVQ